MPFVVLIQGSDTGYVWVDQESSWLFADIVDVAWPTEIIGEKNTKVGVFANSLEDCVV